MRKVLNHKQCSKFMEKVNTGGLKTFIYSKQKKTKRKRKQHTLARYDLTLIFKTFLNRKINGFVLELTKINANLYREVITLEGTIDKKNRETKEKRIPESKKVTFRGLTEGYYWLVVKKDNASFGQIISLFSDFTMKVNVPILFRFYHYSIAKEVMHTFEKVRDDKQICSFCKREYYDFTDTFRCKFCGKYYCQEHIHKGDHKCYFIDRKVPIKRKLNRTFDTKTFEEAKLQKLIDSA